MDRNKISQFTKLKETKIKLFTRKKQNQTL